MMPRRKKMNEQTAKRVAAIEHFDDNALAVARGEEFYVGMGAQRMLGHQVIQVFQEWLDNPMPTNVPPEYVFLADQANLGERLQVCLSAWLDHMTKLAEQRRPRYPDKSPADE